MWWSCDDEAEVGEGSQGLREAVGTMPTRDRDWTQKQVFASGHMVLRSHTFREAEGHPLLGPKVLGPQQRTPIAEVRLLARPQTLTMVPVMGSFWATLKVNVRVNLKVTQEERSRSELMCKQSLRTITDKD